MQASNFGGTFDQLFLDFFMKFKQKMPLYFVNTMVQKKSKMTKNWNQGDALGEKNLFACFDSRKYPFAFAHANARNRSTDKNKVSSLRGQ